MMKKLSPAKIIVECPSNENETGVPAPWDWAGKDNWCWGIASPPIRNIAHFEYLKNKNLMPILTAFLAHPETRARYYQDNNKPVPRTEEVVSKYLENLGNNFVWEGFTEEDSSGVGFSQRFLTNPPRSHEEIRQG